MNIREEWLDIYQQLEARCEAFHDSQSVASGLLDVYDKLSVKQKAEIHPLLAEWLVSDDNKHRYDAAFLIGERQIHELAHAVAAAIDYLKNVSGPEVQDEVEDLRCLQNELR